MPDLAVLNGAPCTLADSGPRDRYSRAPIAPCREPSIALITMICVHEHVDRALSCAGCAVEMQQVADVLICPRCDEDPQYPHECRAVLGIQWLCEGEASG